jgi:hypothetical protein
LRGVEVICIVTYSSIPREQGGAIYAEGQGIIMTKEDGNNGGSETAAWTGQGIAHYSGQRRRDVGSIFCRITSSNGKLAFLNNMVGVFEYEADENGTSRGKIWEWK